MLRDVPSADLVQAALHDLIEINHNRVAATGQRVEQAAPDETTAWGIR